MVKSIDNGNTKRKNKQMNKENVQNSNEVNKVWDTAIAEAERKIEGYKRRIVTLRHTVRILRGLKKRCSADKN